MAIVKQPLRIVDNIKCYIDNVLNNHADYNSVALEIIKSTENNHFWFITRREYIISAFKRLVKKTDKTIEIGSGTGFIAGGIKNLGYDIAVGDIHLSGLYYAKEIGISECYLFDLYDPPFYGEYDVVCMFDVIEHLENDYISIQKAAKILRPNGLLFITVPAHNWLWSRDDTIAAHKRRYSKKRLIDIVEQSGIKVLQVRFFFIILIPLLIIRTITNRDGNTTISDNERNDCVQINPFINFLLLHLTKLENRISNWIPNVVGGSIFLVGSKE